jgi:predicted Holliday junction resolvase-like endonuclease
MTQWALLLLAVATTAGNVIAWLTRQALAASKLETSLQLAAMELRLSEKIQGAYVTWQAHNDLENRVERMERECSECRNKHPR